MQGCSYFTYALTRMPCRSFFAARIEQPQWAVLASFLAKTRIYVCAHAHALPLRCRGKDRTATMGCSCEFSDENSYFIYALTRMPLPLRCRGKDRTATMGCSCEFSSENSYLRMRSRACPFRSFFAARIGGPLVHWSEGACD